MAIMGSTHYVDPKPNVINATWFVLRGLWYFGIAFSIFFVLKSTRLGAITAGIIGWVTLVFCLTGNTNSILGHTLIVRSSSLVMTIRDFIGVVTAAVVVVTSHNIFHKLRVHEF
jgi:VanZ family protein